MGEFGAYMKRLRNRNKLSIRDVAAKTGVSTSYIGQIETERRSPPSPEVMKKLSAIYNIPVSEMLAAAGYLSDINPVSNDDIEVNRAFDYVMSDPQYRSGTRLTGKLSIEVKRFIVEMYEKATGKKLL